MTIGQRIKERRKQLGLSAEQLAERLGKDRATIYRYENNYIEKLPTTVLEPLAQALLTTPAFLMGWTEDQLPTGRVEQQPNQVIAIARGGEKLQYDLSEAEMQAILTLLDSMKKDK